MSSEIVTGRGVQILLGGSVGYVTQNTSAVLAKALFYSPCVSFLVALDLAKTGAMFEAEGYEKHDGNREHKRKAKDDEGERRGCGHGRKV